VAVATNGIEVEEVARGEVSECKQVEDL